MPSMARADLERVERATRLVAEALAERDNAIRAAHASGETYKDIALRAGLSYQRIAQIVKGE